MRFLIQRVNSASVVIDGKTVGSINRGFCVFVGISNTDTEQIADKMIRKLINLRIFSDEDGKTNLNLASVEGEMLIISQFTLYADCRHGNRPSFLDAGKPGPSNELYEYIIAKCKESVSRVEHGEFGADMKVSLVNDGPFTIWLDSAENGESK
ncbi:MAG: D-tyrosyl-tRNA(Tyr) deacylase [Lachnospiraceae bacterium]|nr:D-tyrosyl-tRNA(Tyr) deacylase [Lachnospiraceae bacterium]